MEAVRNFKKFHRIFHNKNVLIQGFKAHVAAKRLNLINLHLQHFVYIQKVERLADEESGEGGLFVLKVKPCNCKDGEQSFIYSDINTPKPTLTTLTFRSHLTLVPDL